MTTNLFILACSFLMVGAFMGVCLGICVGYWRGYKQGVLDERHDQEGTRYE
jgi:hypothetical protein